MVHASGLWPDIKQHLQFMKQIVLLELMVPWKARIEQQHVFLLVKYEDLVSGLRLDGYPTKLLREGWPPLQHAMH